MTRYYVVCVLFFLTAFTQPAIAADDPHYLSDGDRPIPVSYETDVLILGGTTAAVAAAEESAKSGAKTMLVTDNYYLGDDLTATLRLWKPEQQPHDPLVASLYNDPETVVVPPNLDALLKRADRLPFQYVIEEPLKENHRENATNNRLSDGHIGTIQNDSLQTNDGPMTIRLDLGEARPVGCVVFVGFHRTGLCVIESMSVEASNDGENWVSVGFGHRLPGIRPANDKLDTHVLQLDAPKSARYWKARVTHNGYSNTIFASELFLFSDPSAVASLYETDNPLPDSPPRPLHVKRQLDKALLDAGIEFLYGAFETGNIIGPNGAQNGVLINNRAGRQAIVAKRVIDLRLDAKPALEKTKAAKPQTATVEFVVFGGEPLKVDLEKYPIFRNAACERLPQRYSALKQGSPLPDYTQYFIQRYLFAIDREFAEAAFGGDIAKYEELVTSIRLATFHPSQQFTADRISLLAPDEGLFALNEQAIASARQLGKNTGAAAKALPDLEIMALRAQSGTPSQSVPADAKHHDGATAELLDGIRPYDEQFGFVPLPGAHYEVAGQYDVVVIGGGTTGAPAGIAAARAGAKTLVVELQSELGGVGTLGSINGYYFGNKVGFTAEVLGNTNGWNPFHKSNWWATEIRNAGGDIWFGVLGAGAVIAPKSIDGRTQVKGVLLATPFGPKVVLAKVVIDTTGAGDVARAAGSEMSFTTDDEITVQGAGLSPRGLGMYKMNNDYMFVDDTDPIDTTHVFVYGKVKYASDFDQGKVIGTRERRRIVGDFVITPLDQLNLRTYDDSIARSYSDFDSHGYTTSEFLELYHPKKREAYFTYYPYRASLPRNLDGILVGALGTSSHRDAIPMIRMQADLQNQGYALGYIAAQAAKQFGDNPVELRKVDIRKAQKHFVEIGNLPSEVLTETDNYEASKAGLSKAIAELPDDSKNALLVMWHPKESKPMLKEAFEKSNDPERKIVYARALALFDDASGEKQLLERVKNHDGWDEGWDFKAYQQFGSPSSQLDKDIMMLGRLKSKAAVPVIVEKLNQLKRDDDFSHHRACYLALEQIGDPSAAKALADHLKKDKMTGYAHLTIEDAIRGDLSDPRINMAEQSRRDSLKEIGAARALYHLGDYEGLGEKILKTYAKDLRGHFARHAAEELKK